MNGYNTVLLSWIRPAKEGIVFYITASKTAASMLQTFLGAHIFRHVIVHLQLNSCDLRFNFISKCQPIYPQTIKHKSKDTWISI